LYSIGGNLSRPKIVEEALIALDQIGCDLIFESFRVLPGLSALLSATSGSLGDNTEADDYGKNTLFP
jgi:hypothetical protein